MVFNRGQRGLYYGSCFINNWSDFFSVKHYFYAYMR